MTAGAPKVIHVAVGVIWRDGRVLIARRPENAHQGGLLEFPGGKVEPGEAVRQALVRELWEETAVTVAPDALRPLIGIRHDYGDKVVFLDVWEARESTGEPRGMEGQPVFWRVPEALAARDFPAANRPIIAAVRLPTRLAITGDASNGESALATIQAGLSRADAPLLLLRLPSLGSDVYTRVVQTMLERHPGGALLVHDRPELASDLPVAGVHLSWRRASALAARPVSGDRWFGVSCHNAAQLAHAAAIGADYAMLGPVLPTPSHPEAAGMGWKSFTELAGAATLPVYALGGVGPENLDLARAAGAQGVAGISWWWPGDRET